MLESNDLTSEFVRLCSLNELKRPGNSNYFYKQYCVKAYTRPNNGMVRMHSCCIISNKCFFISVCHALETYRVKIDLPNLISKHNMVNNQMVDTDIPYHANLVNQIALENDLRIDFYIGTFDQLKNQWYTTLEPAESYGHGSRLVRILNKGLHFEHLTDIEGGFLIQIDKETERIILEQQISILKAHQQSSTLSSNNQTNQQSSTLSSNNQTNQQSSTLSSNNQTNQQSALCDIFLVMAHIILLILMLLYTLLNYSYIVLSKSITPQNEKTIMRDQQHLPVK